MYTIIIIILLYIYIHSMHSCIECVNCALFANYVHNGLKVHTQKLCSYIYLKLIFCSDYTSEVTGRVRENCQSYPGLHMTVGRLYTIYLDEHRIMPPKKTTVKKVAKKPTAGGAEKNGPGARTSHTAEVGVDTECAACGICEQPIVDGKDQAVYCEGACKQWLHRYCAGVSLSCFQALSSSLTPFQCYSCYQAKHEAAIESLNSEVRALKSEVSEMKAVITGLSTQPNVLQDSVASSRQVSNVAKLLSRPALEATAARSYASAANAPHDPATTSATSAYPLSTSAVALPRISQERKFNVILYGIDEYPRGTSRPFRLQGDLNKAVSLLSGLDNSINSQSVKDEFRLGKFSAENQKPQPLLVKFIRAADATSVLSKRGSLRSSPIFIKPNMSPTEKKSESMLLKERWSLIQSGVPRDAIKIHGSRLFVSNKLHGQIRVSGTSLLLSSQLQWRCSQQCCARFTSYCSNTSTCNTFVAVTIRHFYSGPSCSQLF